MKPTLCHGVATERGDKVTVGRVPFQANGKAMALSNPLMGGPV